MGGWRANGRVESGWRTNGGRFEAHVWRLVGGWRAGGDYFRWQVGVEGSWKSVGAGGAG